MKNIKNNIHNLHRQIRDKIISYKIDKTDRDTINEIFDLLEEADEAVDRMDVRLKQYTVNNGLLGK